MLSHQALMIRKYDDNIKAHRKTQLRQDGKEHKFELIHTHAELFTRK